eukprot:CAMPEP_0113892400 /NCGR_PEP_ID=MMETSP0780_2-20120614/15394_1 /TAXON_ID=652834 /ORGANISM="Palpitomonas bilix" /LENGTH=508 /DNA_ID=CAMNT_0000882331 /DNA_START=98 /DNA_END=1624 /DNA_ORIENTATION=- /assembly_acc=CAM_ASM_000599
MVEVQPFDGVDPTSTKNHSSGRIDNAWQSEHPEGGHLEKQGSSTSLQHNKKKKADPFPSIYLALEIIVIILFINVVQYDFAGVSFNKQSKSFDVDASAGQAQVNKYYPAFQDVHVMIFVGFGFLMTFLKRYMYGALALSFFLAAFAVQWSTLVYGFVEQIIHVSTHENATFHTIHMDMTALITGDFAAGAALVSFGAVIGKASPTQIILMVVFEMIFFSFNEIINVELLVVTDAGGSMMVHTFGAYFGIGFARVISPKASFGNPHQAQGYVSDAFSMIGTLFLWMFWPSFNGALADGAVQERVITNTVLAMTGSCMSAFIFSRMLRGTRKFEMEDIQNATLAGGVAVGTAADMIPNPGIAILVGFLGGLLSTIGYVYISGALERAGLHDTCGVHNLHGMPGLLGATIGAICAGAISTGDERFSMVSTDVMFSALNSTAGCESVSFLPCRTPGQQGGVQFLALVLTVMWALGGGFITGLILKKVDPPKKLFQDEYFETPEDYDEMARIL